MDDLRSDWNLKYKGQKRVIIHLPSVSVAKAIRRNMSNVKCKQLQQIGRFRDLLDPNVILIYISLPICDDVKDTFNCYLSNFAFDTRVLEDATFTDRFHVIIPETSAFYTPDSSLTAMLLSSTRALQKVGSIIAGLPAYIVPGDMGDNEIALSAALEVPIFCNFVISRNLAFNLTNQYDLLSRCEISIPQGEPIVGGELDSDGLLSTIFRLISDCRYINRWIFKINDHTDQSGVAYWDSSDITSRSPSHSINMKSIYDSLRHNFTLVRNDTSYSDVSDYLNALIALGGVIQATPPVNYESGFSFEEKSRLEFPNRFPSMHYLIYPDDGRELSSSSDQICISPYRFWGIQVPQQSCLHDEIAAASKKVIDCLISRGYFGYVSVDFVCWDDHPNAKRNLWCIGVKPYLTNAHAYCLNYLTATHTKIIQLGGGHSGTTMLDMNRARTIIFKYLNTNQFIDLSKVKRAARMAVYEGDEDLVNRVGLYSPHFMHYGMHTMTSVGVETFLLNSGFLLHMREKIGLMCLNSERTDKERVSIMFSHQNQSDCLELVLQAIVALYRRFMTIEGEEPSNFVDIALCLVPELRRARHREAIFNNPAHETTSIDPEFYPVKWQNSRQLSTYQQAYSSNVGISIRIDLADAEDDPTELAARQHKATGSTSLAALTASQDAFHEASLSPVARVHAPGEMSLFVAGNDTVQLLTSVENEQIRKRLASNRLEEIVVQVVDLPQVQALPGDKFDEFSPVHRVRLLAKRKLLLQAPMPTVMPDPKSIALLNSLIPSNALWGKYLDYGEEEEYELVMPERLDDPDRIPLGLPMEQYLQILDDQRERKEFIAQMERERQARHEEQVRREKKKKQLALEEELAMQELAALILLEKQKFVASGKGPLTAKIQEEIEYATRRYFFDKAAQEKYNEEQEKKAQQNRAQKGLRLKDFMGKVHEHKMGGKGHEDLNALSVRASPLSVTQPVSRRGSIGVRKISEGPAIRSITMRSIGEKWLGLRSTTEG
ncbi:hypothetical protein BC830DRAFT_871680 [Chytriomyces sp. MP71]|nr:hypothetical protein BC830DRAFT_871680 [Chytriomyces sp. MP71]